MSTLQQQANPRRASLSAARIVPDRRLHKRFKVSLPGRFMLPDQSEHACKTIDLSPGGVAIASNVSVEPGDRIVGQFEHIGSVVGQVARIFPGGFAIALSATSHKREKLAAQITWIVNRGELNGGALERRHERFGVKQRVTTVKLDEDIVIECQILDVSLSGASLGTDARPPIGHVVTVGKQLAKVMRYHAQGIGVQFLEPQERETLQRDFG
jgi:hypothetical protein